MDNITIFINTELQMNPKENSLYSLLRLLQLSSPSLPIGSYAYSQGLESVIEHSWIKTADDLQQWLTGTMRGSLLYVDLPLLSRLYTAFYQSDSTDAQKWNDILIAYRETSELRQEELNKGHAITSLLNGIETDISHCFSMINRPSFITGYSYASVHWNISLGDAAHAYIWAWLENQLVSAMKLMAIGQIASQRILSELIADIPDLVQQGLDLDDDELGQLLPLQTIACALHETQYSRLFRS